MKKLLIASLFTMALSTATWAQTAKPTSSAESVYQTVSKGASITLGTGFEKGGVFGFRIRSHSSSDPREPLSDITLIELGSNGSGEILASLITGNVIIPLSGHFGAAVGLNLRTISPVSLSQALMPGLDGLGVAYHHSTGKVTLTGNLDFLALRDRYRFGEQPHVMGSWKTEVEQQVGALVTLNASLQRGQLYNSNGANPHFFDSSTDYLKGTASILLNVAHGDASIGVNGAYEKFRNSKGETSDLTIRAVAQAKLSAIF